MACERTAPPVPVTVAHGDGIGPEIMTACLRVLEAGGAALDIETAEIGERVYLAGQSSGIGPDAWDSLRRTKLFFKGPISTPQGGGYKSLNVTIRKTLGMYANIRPCIAYAPHVATRHPGMDVTIVRENEEDLYAGIEHRQTDEVYQCLKLITRPGCEKIVRYAFEHARAHGRKKVTCFTKDNIMKLTDGLFHAVFDEIRGEYPDIASDHMIVDIGAARLADTPEAFDVIVMPNLYGDILSDVAAQITGSVGLGPSANIGEHCAMFEAIHGSAPDLAGRGIANPSGLLLAGVMMLVHIGQAEAAERVHNAWLRAIEDGQHTGDIRGAPGLETTDTAPLGTAAFADAVIARLGQLPQSLAPASYAGATTQFAVPGATRRKPTTKKLVGVDVFVQSTARVEELAARLKQGDTRDLALTMITNRGVMVWPRGGPETFHTDHWRCRFEAVDGTACTKDDILTLLSELNSAGADFIKNELLYTFDGEPGFSLGQGQ
ncbi:MAG: NADP-dependent isocitrate dehydrogenase [Parerythrobacter sp.]